VAADVYGGPGYEGRGGWTWYTGSAGWMYRFAIEGFLGIHREGERLSLRPALPSHLNAYEAEVSIGGKAVAIKVERSGDGYQVSANGKTVEEKDGAFAVGF
jgi:cyclic beta-1,2-glucan synthetase